jgi:hypothetical protein
MIISIGLKTRMAEQQSLEKKAFALIEKSDNIKQSIMAEQKITQDEYYTLVRKILPIK